MSAESRVEALIGALEAERAAILAGDFQQLAQLQERKAELGVALERDQLSAQEMQALSDSITRNASLLKAASAGVAQARDAITTLKRAMRTSVYDKDGTMSDMDTRATKVERKA